MRHLPDGDFKWICHLVDYWSKFNWALPLERKTAEEVANVLHNQVFHYFGLPTVLHSDNGREFVNSILKEVVATWPGQVHLVSG